MSALRLDVYAGPFRQLDNGGQFSPTTSTLVIGERESVLVDTQFTSDDVDEVIRLDDGTITIDGETMKAIVVGQADIPNNTVLHIPSIAAVIAGSVGTTASYIRDFLTEVAVADGSRDLVERMQRRYPDHGNPSALIASAVTALKRRQADSDAE